jgi:DNA-directed RNA polymerase specialized sigma24 family protein
MQDKDVAEISGIKTETHKSRKRRALIELRKILKVKIKTKNMDNKPYRK